MPIIIYTHTDYSDVWPILFGQIKKYLVNFDIIIFTNEKDKNNKVN
jgi:hypothetical protein